MLQAKLAPLWVQDNRLKDFNGRYAHNLVPKLEECGGCHFLQLTFGEKSKFTHDFELVPGTAI